MKTVYELQIISANFIKDYGQSLKNIIGGNLKSYEQMTRDTTNKCLEMIYLKHPLVKNVKIEISIFAHNSVLVLVYGELHD